jgi:ribose 5-phosphate isomerase A
MACESASETDELARQAVAPITSGMVIGLGTGRAASRGIEALGLRVKRESLEVVCVATSARSAEIAGSLGLDVRRMRDVGAIDYLFDGADEVDPSLAMTKGAGGAMTWEKIAAEAASRRVYCIDESKVVARLGERFALPVEALAFGLLVTAQRLRLLGLEPALRLDDKSTVAIGKDGVALDEDVFDRAARTDEGNCILDCAYGDAGSGGLKALADGIDLIPGVVGHGLFVDQADVVLIESADRSRVERRER